MTASIQYDSTGNVRFGAGIGVSDQTEYITQDSTGNIKAPAGLGLSNQVNYLTANSTAALIIPRAASLPAVRVPGGIVFVYNSTTAAIAFHTTGTTWKYANITSVL
jgi:hypothetical protein